VWKTGGAETILSEPEAVVEDEIFHIVVTHLDSDGADSGSADRSRLYVNGVMIEEMEDPEEIPSLDSIADGNDIFSILFLGTLSSQGGYWGELDDFQLYSTELSAEQIAEMYASPGSLANFGSAVRFEITDVDLNSKTRQVSLTWNSKNGKSYTVEHSDDPNSFLWLELADGVQSEGDTTTFVDVTTGDANQRSYRIVEEG
jgi:hypothetical protein